MGALSGKPLNLYLLAHPWFSLENKTKQNKTTAQHKTKQDKRVKRKPGEVGLKGTWGMRFAKPSGHHVKQLISACPNRMEEEEAKLAHARGSPLPWLEQLLLSTPLCPPGSNSEVTIFAKANSKAGGCFPPNSHRTTHPTLCCNDWFVCVLHRPQEPWSWRSCVHHCPPLLGPVPGALTDNTDG